MNKQKDQMRKSISYEIRSPMTVILGYLEVLLETKLDKKQINYVESVLLSAKSLLKNIEALLDKSWLKAESEDRDFLNFYDQEVCKGIKVLVVEDSEPNQELIKEYFNFLGCEGEFVNNGKEAVDKVKNDNFFRSALLICHVHF